MRRSAIRPNYIAVELLLSQNKLLYPTFLLFGLYRFPVDDDLNMKSVVEYFQEMYGFAIQHTHLPCLQVGNQKKANYLPMEVISC